MLTCFQYASNLFYSSSLVLSPAVHSLSLLTWSDTSLSKCISALEEVEALEKPESSEIGESGEATSPCSDSRSGSEVEDEPPRVLEGPPLSFP